MPHLHLQLSGPVDDPHVARVAGALADITADALGKARELIAITVEVIAAERWFVGGSTLAASGERAFNLEISVTDETNTKAEKARFLARVHAAMAALHAPLSEVSYVHVVDARAAAYGYGGRTQEYRHQRDGV